MPNLNTTIIPLIVACALIMQTLDATIVTTALPQIAAEFQTSPVSLSMCITAYILSMAVFIPVSGWVADRFGARFVFCAAITIFTLGSLLCGLSQSAEQLTAARVIQGMGGAMMVPVGRLVLLRSVSKTELVAAMATLSLPGQIGPVLGPVVGGFITSYFSWRWIFLINLPIGVLGIALALIYIRDHGKPERKALDWVGFLLSGCALSSLMYAMESLGHGAAEPLLTAGAFLLGLGTGVIAVLHARRKPQPLLDLPLLRVPTYALANASNLLFRLGAGSLPFLLPLLFQEAIGMTPLLAGLLIAINPIASLPMKVAAIRLLKRFGYRNALRFNAIICAGLLMVCGLFDTTTPLWVIALVMALGGFFMSLQYTGLQTLTYADIPPPSMSTATSLASMVQQLSNGIGVAISALLLQGALKLSGSPHVTQEAMQIAFIGIGLFGLLPVLLLSRLRADAGAELSGHAHGERLRRDPQEIR